MDDLDNDILSLMQDILEFHENNYYLPPEMMDELSFLVDVYHQEEE